ncbi:unnamed protein product [Effrenium voratum]|uniref:FPL domain-containing protein n=1 Tax=Effrenium voratum TaxID=2562239 RepID=A0AA36JBA6_9DINO|nr:unnamed protein product [Effrenium voratum]
MLLDSGFGQIRKATACLVWSETHDSSLFNLFCEHTMLAGFVAALRAASPVPVKLQILQTLSILVQNAQRDTSFIYLLSQGLLNDFFDDPPANMDEEALAYFITLLKGIAFRLDGQLALLCLQRNPRRGCGYEGATPSTSSASPTATPSPSEGPSLRMPIFERSVRLIGHPDPMVQTSARSAALRLLSFEGPVKGAVEPAAAGERAFRAFRAFRASMKAGAGGNLSHEQLAQSRKEAAGASWRRRWLRWPVNSTSGTRRPLWRSFWTSRGTSST